jgi:hypothetical protein
MALGDLERKPIPERIEVSGDKRLTYLSPPRIPVLHQLGR